VDSELEIEWFAENVKQFVVLAVRYQTIEQAVAVDRTTTKVARGRAEQHAILQGDRIA
jgi:hypothetical protein